MSAIATSINDNQLSTMTIYDFPQGPYPTRVRIALAEKNLQSRVRFVLVDLYAGEHKKPEFMASKNFRARCRCSNSMTGPVLPSARR